MRTFDWAVEDIIAAHPALYLEHCAVMAVALMSRGPRPYEFLLECEGFHPPGVGNESEFLVRLAWTDATEQKAMRMRRTEQPKPIIERAAVALAALTIGRLLPNGQMRVARTGDRADYWLPDMRHALEISGTERRTDVSRRCREKVAQVLGNPLRWSGHVFVCCFAAPRGQARWIFVRQEER